MSPSKQRKPVDMDAETTRVDRIRQAVRLEIQACTERASEIVAGVKRKVESHPAPRLVVVRR